VLEKHLVGILLVVFIKDKHRPYTSDVYGATVGVGILGMAGNKGGASVRFKFYDSHICFGACCSRSLAGGRKTFKMH
jgi:phosphatidylinositol-bisphosphatase